MADIKDTPMSTLKYRIQKNKLLASVSKPVYFWIKSSRNFSSGKYWEERYTSGGNSGAGSYGQLAEFKANFLNSFVKKNKIKTVIEFGSGDGSQLLLFNFQKYIGLDVSKASISKCISLFSNDSSKSFFLYDSEYFLDNHHLFQSDLGLSLDVIYHLVEDEVFSKYMTDLFQCSKKFVIIYSSNSDIQEKVQAQHVRHRKFTEWVNKNTLGWKLQQQKKNDFANSKDPKNKSFANFYIYKKI